MFEDFGVIVLVAFIGCLFMIGGYIAATFLQLMLPSRSSIGRFLIGLTAIGVLNGLARLNGQDEAWTNVCTCFALFTFCVRSAILGIMGPHPPLVTEPAPEIVDLPQAQVRQITA